MKEDSIDELKQQIRILELKNKILKDDSNAAEMTIKLLVTAGHLNEDKLEQARELARSIN